MATAESIAELEARARTLRRHVIGAAAGQFAHVGGALSCADLMAVLFFGWLRLEGHERDHFLLSKGHAVTILHACMVELGWIGATELKDAGKAGSRLAGHPTMKAPGVEFATGSLGHALSVGLGIAMGKALDASPARTVVLLGDGELQEGTVWEAALAAPRFASERLLAIVDYNRFQSGGAVDRVLPLEPLVDKWRSFGWHTLEVDGHDAGAIAAALASFPAAKRPTALIAHTVKGKGLPGIEGTARAHYTRLEEAEARRALEALS